MRKTLLLCFIHGFKGGDDTFGAFPEHLRALVSHALPLVTVTAITYPQFETRGDLKECVGRFREWLQNAIIDLEVAASTPSPTIDPSVHTILIGHSMGGIVAADTLLALAAELPIAAPADTHAFMFPAVVGLLAFDTPFLGVAPGVVAYGAHGHYKTVSTALSTLGEVAGVFGWGPGGKSEVDARRDAAQRAAGQAAPARALLPAPGPSEVKDTASDTPGWQRWGRYAIFAGAAGAVAAAGGAAAYARRETLSEGWGWVGSHLEFVGCLMRGEELRRRLVAVAGLEAERGLGFADLYTNLGLAAKADSGTGTGTEGAGLLLEGGERTFCSLPRSELRRFFVKCVNDWAEDEMVAHTSMFFPSANPGYFGMCERAKELVVGWAGQGWGGDEVSVRAGDGDGGGDAVGVDGLGGVRREKGEGEEVRDDDTDALMGG